MSLIKDYNRNSINNKYTKEIYKNKEEKMPCGSKLK